MPGERTPDVTPPFRQGSSDDDISLREHMQRQIDTLSHHFDEKLAAQTAHFDLKVDGLKSLLDERYASQAEAIRKVEMATEKRFEGVNEFRQQLNDQAQTFMPRAESISRHDRNAESLAMLQQRHDADVSAINKRLDLTQGASTGLDKAWGYLVAAVLLAGTIVGIVLAVTR